MSRGWRGDIEEMEKGHLGDGEGISRGWQGDVALEGMDGPPSNSIIFYFTCRISLGSGAESFK